MGFCRNLYIFMCFLNHSVSLQMNELTAAIASPRTSHPQRVPRGQKKSSPVVPYAHGGYKTSFEACFLDLGCLEKHIFFNSTFGKRQKTTSSVDFHKVSSVQSFSDWLSSSHRSVEQFQSRNICSYDKTD